MQPISNGMGYPQGYPMYPNCFDQLTTHGIVADDVMGYITDAPSPYLQNYVAQQGWNPSMPGQILPDPLPNVQPPQQLPRGDIYQSVNPKHPDASTFVKKDKYDTAKKVALGLLLTGLAVFGVMKGKSIIAKLRGTPTPPAPPTPPTP